MKISIIIVNYKVKTLTCQCISSIKDSTISPKDYEIIVIDNHSQDGSIEFIKKRHPNIKLISNEINLGFSKANNKGIYISQGKYLLLLNPDTIIEKNVLEKCMNFMGKHPQAGALGVQIINGYGAYLPESKRDIPLPKTSFYKIIGLSKLFPKSKTFSNYHLGHLSENKTHEISILSGAFMFLRKDIIDKIGVFDEKFFMYGEDIDLSYRIIKEGYKNFYFSESKIIHYKGESTSKTTIRYINRFHKAMIIFTKKHFSKETQFYINFIYLAIYFRAIFVALYSFFYIPFNLLNKTIQKQRYKNIIAIGDTSFFNLIESNQSAFGKQKKIIKIKYNNEINENDSDLYKGRLYQLKDFIEIYKAKIVLFNSNYISYTSFINILIKIKKCGVKSYISYENNTLISSNSIINLSK